MDLHTLPQEIIKFILSFLNDKGARVARLVNTDWFRWIKYNKFYIYFATSSLLPQIVDQLLKYQYPIELSLFKPSKKLLDSDILENISRLTHLKSFELRDPKTANTQEYFKLSTLTNLETLYFGSGRNFSPELLRHFPRMKECNNFEYSEELVQIVNAHCPYYQSMLVEDDLLSLVPVSVTQLEIVDMSDKSLEELTRLTKLKYLHLRFANDNRSGSINLRHITWLENLHIETLDVTGLECSRQLTELYISDYIGANASPLLESLATLPKLDKLGMYIYGQVGPLSALSNLTSLWLNCANANAASFPTSLLDLEIEFQDFNLSVQFEDISHLIHLTQLTARGTLMNHIEPLQTLTKLQELTLSMAFKHCISFSTLGNLTYLNTTSVDVDAQTVKCLTNLQHLKLFSSPTEQTTMDSLQYLSLLTHLSFRFFDETVFFDYQVIQNLPLAYLQVHLTDVKNCWAVLPTLTTLEDLSIEFVEDEEQIASLATFSKLTRLVIRRAADNVTCLHITKLTTLQKLSVYFENDLGSSIDGKLTRLQSVYGIKM